MFLRTFLFSVFGGFWGVLVLVVASYIDGTVPLEYIRWNYWLFAFVGGFLAGTVGNLVNEYLGLYRDASWGRRFRRWVARRWNGPP
jgi:hypothetical protein